MHDTPVLPITPADYEDLVDSTAAIVGSAIRSGNYVLPRGTTLAFVAEEILSGAVATACEKAAQYDPSRSIVPWIMQIAANKLLARYRDESRRDQVSIDDLLDHSEDAFGILEGSDMEARIEARLEVEQLLGHLKPEYADVLRRRYIDGHEIDEIADALGISKSAVEKRLSRARGQARQLLS